MFTMSRKVHSVLLVVMLLLLANIHHINAQTNSISNSNSNSGSSSEDSSTEIPDVNVVLDDGDEDTTSDTDTSTSISDSTDEDTTTDSTENDDEDGTSLTDNSVSDSVDDSGDGDDEDTTTNNGSDSDSTDTSDDGSGTDTNGSDSDSGDDSDDDTTTITQEDAERCQGSITTKPCDCLTNVQCGQRDDCGLQQGCLSNEEISENRLVSNGAATSNEAAASDEMWAAIGGSTGGLLILGLALGGFYLYRKRKNLNEETGTKVGKSMSLQPSEQVQDPENPTPMSDNAMSPQRPLPPRPPMSPDGHPMGVMGHTGVAMPMGSGMNKEIKQEKWRDDETEVDGIEETAASHSKQGIVRPMSSTNGSRHTSITSRQAEEEKAQEL